MEDNIEVLMWLAGIMMLSLVIIIVILIRIYRRDLYRCRNEQLEKRLLQNLRVEHKERARIAKELHDGLCNDLATLKNFAGVLELSSDKDLIKQTIRDIQENISTSYDTALRISYNLSPPLISDNTITALLHNYLLRVGRASTIKMIFKANEQTFTLSEVEKIEIYRIVQELIQNIVKHSFASYALVNLIWKPKCFVLNIVDNGIQYNSSIEKQRDTVGLGLSNIQVRIQQISAEFEHKSNKEANIINLRINRHEHKSWNN